MKIKLVSNKIAQAVPGKKPSGGRNKLLLFACFIIFLFIFGRISYLLGVRTGERVVAKRVPVKTVSIKPQSTNAETNWSRFNLSQFGVAFNIPPTVKNKPEVPPLDVMKTESRYNPNKLPLPNASYLNNTCNFYADYFHEFVLDTVYAYMINVFIWAPTQPVNGISAWYNLCAKSFHPGYLVKQMKAGGKDAYVAEASRTYQYQSEGEGIYNYTDYFFTNYGLIYDFSIDNADQEPGGPQETQAVLNSIRFFKPTINLP